MKRAIVALGLCGLTFFVWIAFARAQNQLHLSADTTQARQEILTLVPLGEDVKQAKLVMERNGFACQWEKNEQFATFSSGKQVTHSKADYLYCDREQGWITPERWQVAVVHKKGKVTDVRVSYGLIGL